MPFRSNSSNSGSPCVTSPRYCWCCCICDCCACWSADTAVDWVAASPVSDESNLVAGFSLQRSHKGWVWKINHSTKTSHCEGFKMPVSRAMQSTNENRRCTILVLLLCLATSSHTHNSTKCKLTMNQPLLFYNTNTILTNFSSLNPLKAYRHAFQWLHHVIRMCPKDYGGNYLAEIVS